MRHTPIVPQYGREVLLRFRRAGTLGHTALRMNRNCPSPQIVTEGAALKTFIAIFAVAVVCAVSSEAAEINMDSQHADRGQQRHLAVPNKTQYDWHEQERLMFIHFGAATWQGHEYDNHTTKLSRMNPDKLDVEQWMATAKSWAQKKSCSCAST